MNYGLLYVQHTFERVVDVCLMDARMSRVCEFIYRMTIKCAENEYLCFGDKRFDVACGHI